MEKLHRNTLIKMFSSTTSFEEKSNFPSETNAFINNKREKYNIMTLLDCIEIVGFV